MPITILLSGDAYQGPPVADITLDGVALPSVTVTVPHGQPSQRIVLNAAPGPHTLILGFANDAWGGTPDTDRNLYLDGVEGAVEVVAPQPFMRPGSITLTLTVPDDGLAMLARLDVVLAEAASLSKQMHGLMAHRSDPMPVLTTTSGVYKPGAAIVLTTTAAAAPVAALPAITVSPSAPTFAVGASGVFAVLSVVPSGATRTISGDGRVVLGAAGGTLVVGMTAATAGTSVPVTITDAMAGIPSVTLVLSIPVTAVVAVTTPPGITSSVTNPGADGFGPGIYFPEVVYGRTSGADSYARNIGTGFARLETGGIQVWTVTGNAAFSFGGIAGTTLTQQPSIAAAGDVPLTITVTDGITTKTKAVTARISAKAVTLGANLLLDTSPVNYSYKNITDPLSHFSAIVEGFTGDFSGATSLALTDPAGLFQIDPHYSTGNLRGLIVSTDACYPLPQHYGARAGVAVQVTYGDGTTAAQPVPIWIAQEQPAAISFIHPALFDFYATGDVWGQLTAFCDAGVLSLAVAASDVPMTINAQGRPVLTGVVVAGIGKRTTFRVTSKNGTTTDLTVTYDVGAGTVLAPSAMTMAVSTTLDNYVQNQIVGTPAVSGMTGPITWALVQEDTYTGIYGSGTMMPFIQDLATGQVSCPNPPPATNQGTGAHPVTGKLGPVRRPNGHIITLVATSGSVRCKRVFNVQVAWHVGPVIQVGRGMKAAYGALGEDTFENAILRFNRYYGGPSAADAGGTLNFHWDADPNYYANSGMTNYILRQGIMGPVKMRWADPTQPRPRLGGTVGAATMPTTNAKAFILANNGDMVIEGLEVSWCHGYDNIHGQSNIRKDEESYGDLTVIDCNIHDGDNGIEVGSGPDRFWAVRSAFSNFGDEYVRDGATHGIYASGLLEVNVYDCLFHRINNGHNVKSRAARTNIIDSRLYDGERGNASNLIDSPYGGDLLVQGCDIHKGPNQQNPYAIQHGEEGEQYGTNNPRRHSARVLNNRIAMMLPVGNHSGSGCVVSTADARSNIDGSGSSLVMTANSIYLRPGDGGIVRNQSPYGAHSGDRQIVPQTETGTVLLGVPFALDFSDPTTGQLMPRPGPAVYIADGSDTFPNFTRVQIDVGSDDIRIPANSAIGTPLTPGGRADGTILSVFMDPASPYGAPFGPGTVWAVVQDPQYSGAVPWAPVGRYGVTTNADGTCVPKVAGALGAAGTVDYFKLRATGPGGIVCDYRVYVVLT